MTAVPAGATDHQVDADGDRIRVIERGEGRPLLLIHGAFGSGARLLQTPFGRALAARRRVIAPDSLAHGGSDAPEDPSRYGPRQRAAQLNAVLEALAPGPVEVVGYSMGGWMASALATFHPERVGALAIGGWDIARGMYTPAAAWGLPRITCDILVAAVRRDRPELLAEVRPGTEAALAAAVDAMNDLEGLAEGVVRCAVPTALWVGREDLYHDAARRLASGHGFTFLSLPGDHASVLEAHGREAAGRALDFLDRAAIDGRVAAEH